METIWRQDEDKMETRWRQDGVNMETRWRQDGDKIKIKIETSRIRYKQYRHTQDRWRQKGGH